MKLPLYRDHIKKADWNLVVTDPIPSQRFTFTVPGTYPIDTLWLIVSGTMANASNPSVMHGDGLLSLIKNINVTVNDGLTTTRVNASAAGLCEHYQNLIGLPATTIAEIARSPQGGVGYAAGQTFRLEIPIMFGHPQLCDPLRIFTLLPAHQYKSDPVITVDFASRSEMGNDAQTKFSAITFELAAEYRLITPAWQTWVESKGGFLYQEIVENEYVPGASAIADYRLPLNQPGALGGLLIRGYAAANYGRGNPTDTNNPYWRIETAGVPRGRFVLDHVQSLNEVSKAAGAPRAGISGFTAITDSTGGTPNDTFAAITAGGAYAQADLVSLKNIAATVAAKINSLRTYCMATSPGSIFSNSYYLDFITDFTAADQFDLGSLIDLEQFGPNAKSELIGSVSGSANNRLKILTHKFMGARRFMPQAPTA